MFDILAWITLGVGVLAGLIGLLAATNLGSPLAGLTSLLVNLAAAVASWAVMSLGSVLSSYVADRAK